MIKKIPLELIILMFVSILVYHSWLLPGVIRWGDMGYWFDDKSIEFFTKAIEFIPNEFIKPSVH